MPRAGRGGFRTCSFSLGLEARLGWWLEQGLWSPISWTQISALQFTGCVSLGGFVKLSGPQSTSSVTWGNGNDSGWLFRGPHVQAHGVNFLIYLDLFPGSSRWLALVFWSASHVTLYSAMKYFGPTFQYYDSGFAAYKTFAWNSISAIIIINPT